MSEAGLAAAMRALVIAGQTGGWEDRVAAAQRAAAELERAGAPLQELVEELGILAAKRKSVEPEAATHPPRPGCWTCGARPHEAHEPRCDDPTRHIMPGYVLTGMDDPECAHQLLHEGMPLRPNSMTPTSRYPLAQGEEIEWLNRGPVASASPRLHPSVDGRMTLPRAH